MPEVSVKIRGSSVPSSTGASMPSLSLLERGDRNQPLLVSSRMTPFTNSFTYELYRLDYDDGTRGQQGGFANYEEDPAPRTFRTTRAYQPQ